MLKWMAIALLIALFPTLMIGLVLGLLANPYFFLVLVLLLLALPSITALMQRQNRAR